MAVDRLAHSSLTNRLRKERALEIFRLFLDHNAVLGTDISDWNAIASTRAAIDTLPSGSVQDAFKECVALAEKSIGASLGEFRKSLNLGLGALYGADVLDNVERMTDAEMQQCIVDTLRSHLVNLRDDESDSSEDRKRAQAISGCLVDMLRDCGVPDSLTAEFQASAAGERHRSIWKKTSGTKARKVHEHSGHQFVATHYNYPTFCFHCRELLWGLGNQGYQCNRTSRRLAADRACGVFR